MKWIYFLGRWWNQWPAKYWCLIVPNGISSSPAVVSTSLGVWELALPQGAEEFCYSLALLCKPYILTYMKDARIQERYRRTITSHRRRAPAFVSVRISIEIGRFRKHNATPNRDVTCLGMAWARLPVNREVASAWLSQRKELFSDVARAAPCFWGPLTPFSLQYRLRQHVRLSLPRSMMTYHVVIWRRVVFSKSA